MNPASSRSGTIVPTACATHIVQDGVSATSTALLPVLAEVFGLNYAQVGLLKGLKSIVQAALEAVSGELSERMGERGLIVAGLVLSGAGYLLLTGVQSTLYLAMCLLFVGAGTALHHAPSSALIANGFSTATRSSVLGIYNASGDVGKLTFAGVFSLATLAGFAWQQVSLLYGFIAILVAMTIALTLRGSGRADKAAQGPAGAPEEVGAPKGWGILNWKSFGALLFVTSTDTLVQSSVMVFISFLMLAKGLSLPLAVGTTTLLLAGGVLGKAGCGYLADRMGVRAAFSLVQVLTALGLTAIVFSPLWLAVALVLPIGAAVQGTSSITYGFAADLIDPRKMARGYALMYSSGTLASAIGPLAVGAIADAYGIRTAICLLAFTTLLAVPPLFVMRETANRAAT